MPGKPKIEESCKTKAVTRVFPRQLQLRKSMNIHLVSLFKEKTPRPREKSAAEINLSFSCLQGNHAFRHCPRAKKRTKSGCTSSLSVLLHVDERVFPS